MLTAPKLSKCNHKDKQKKSYVVMQNCQLPYSLLGLISFPTQTQFLYRLTMALLLIKGLS